MADRSPDDSASLPSAFADAPDPEPTEQRATTSSNDSTKTADKSTRSETGLKSSGVPTVRLLGWAVPVLGVVAGVAMYNQSPPLAAGVFAVAFFVAFLMLVGHWIRRRNAKSSTGGSRGTSSGGRGGGSSSPRAKRRWLPWSRGSGGSSRSGGGSRGGGRSNGSTGSAGGGRGSGGLRGLFHRGGSGRGGSGGGASGRSSGGRKSPNGGGAGTKSTGSPSSSGSGATKRSLNPFRRNRTATAGTGSPNGTKSTSSHHATGSTGRPTGSGGSRGGGSRNPFRRRNTSPTSPSGPKGSKPSAATPSGKSSTTRSGTTGSGRSIRHPFRRNPDGPKPAGGKHGASGGGRTDKDRGGKSSDRIRQAGAERSPDSPRWRDRFGQKNPDGTKPQPAAETKGDTKNGNGGPKGGPKSTKGERKRNNSKGTTPIYTDDKTLKDAWKPYDELEKEIKAERVKWKQEIAQRKETASTLKELGPIDDMGFQLVDRTTVKASGTAPPRKVVDPEPIDVDDCGFPIYPKVTPITKNNKLKEHQLSLDTSQYTSRVDTSTPQTLRTTLAEAASAARLDAGTLNEQASELRRTAAGLEDRPGMRLQAENLLNEARALDDTAEGRLGMAAGFENSASTVPA